METLRLIIPLIFFLLMGYIIFVLVKKQNKKLTEIQDDRKRESLVKEELKNSNKEEYDRILQEEDEKKRIKNEKDKTWKEPRNGLIIFGVIQLIIEISLSIFTETEGNNHLLAVGVNYAFSQLYIKNQIYKKNKIIDRPVLFGLGVSMIIFCIRLILGGVVGILTEY